MDNSAVVALLGERLRIWILLREVDIAACAIFVWDYFITLGMEIEYIWPEKWTAIKVLYLLQRYLPFFDTVWLVLHQELGANLSPSTCRLLTNAGRSLFIVGMASSELVLAFRAWAIWNRNRVLTIVLSIIFTGVWITQVYILTQNLGSLEFTRPPLPQFIGCFIGGNLESNGILLSWVLLLVWDTILMILMIIPALKAYRFRGHSALYTTVYAEGIVYYVYLFVLSSVNILLLRLESIDIGYRFIIVTMTRCLHTVLTSRAVLHIRDRVNRPHQLEIMHGEIPMRR